MGTEMLRGVYPERSEGLSMTAPVLVVKVHHRGPTTLAQATMEQVQRCRPPIYRGVTPCVAREPGGLSAMLGGPMAGASPATTMRRPGKPTHACHGSGTPCGCHVRWRVPCSIAPYLSFVNRLFHARAAGFLALQLTKNTRRVSWAYLLALRETIIGEMLHII